MRFAGIKELKQETMDLIKESKQNDIFITSYGKPVAVLHHITEDDLADYLIENDPEFKSRIEEAFADYTAKGGITAETMIKKLKKRSGTKKV
ncbi:MAG: type II toxin-antitoxin system prevent-host-death family antitoxin [Thermodesulfobacteriota bacterium]|jgi:prevent-host-death family protein|nr:MAG: type II toxin-antitoxin system prevent-host-death family antitoxin [Thermodesulfobacteriota bacterium]